MSRNVLIAVVSLAACMTALANNTSVVAWGYNCCGQTNVPPNATNVVAVSAASGNHSLALRNDGSVVAWGDNSQGQCNVPADLHAIAVAGGHYHSIALQENGVVIAWGQYFVSGGGMIAAFVPDGLSNVVAIAVGVNHDLALKSDGTVVIWGSTSYVAPVPEGLSNVISIAAGAAQNLALKSDGTVTTWGAAHVPFYPPPPGLSNVVAISASHYNFAALKGDSTIALWGMDGYGQTTVPTALSNNVAAIAAGREAYTALKTDGTAISWGYNSFNQTNVPPLQERVLAVSGGGGHWLALIKTGLPEIMDQPLDQTTFTGKPVSFRVKAFGSSPLQYQWRFNSSPIAGATNATFVLGAVATLNAGNYDVVVRNGFGETTSSLATLTVVESAPFIVTQPISRVGYLNRSASFTVVADGSAPLRYQWRLFGTNIPGATNSTLLLNPVTTNKFGPYSVRITNAFGSTESVSADLSPGPVFAWGDNSAGQIDVPLELANVVAIAGGALHSLALKSDGTVAGWGSNGYSETTPHPWLTNVAAISAGNQCSIVLYSNANARAWGLTAFDDLTNIAAVAAGLDYLFLDRQGTAFLRNNVGYSPSPPESATNLVAISVGFYHSLGIRTDGCLLAWGDDTYGQARLPTTAPEFVAVAAGERFSLALRGDGTVLPWGNNDLGQTNVPPDATNVVAISAGRAHAMALRQDGRVFVWGDTNSGRGIVPQGLTFATSISCGYEHNLALLGTGDLRFSRHPRNQTLKAGRRTLLSAFASGAGPIYYQWTRDGTNIVGATNAHFIIADSQEWDGGSYAIIASHSGGAITSTVATVTVTPSPPVFLQQPDNLLVRASTGAVLQASVIGTSPLSFQWRFNDIPLPGETNRVLMITSAQPAHTGNYQLLASNSLGMATSTVARLEVYALEALPLPVTTLGAGSVAWGDFDNDGQLDLLTASETGVRPTPATPLLFRNTGNGNFTNVNVPFTSPPAYSVAWGDFDNDTYLDIAAAITGVGVEIWHNNGNGTFAKLNSNLAGDVYAKLSLVDFDCDGRLDVLTGGALSRNLGSNRFEYLSSVLPVTEYSWTDWGDYNSDGSPDLLVCGLIGGIARLHLFKNLGDGTFTNINSGLPNIYRGAVAWLDIDSDGRLDIVLSGEAGGTRLTDVYRNRGDDTFSLLVSDLPPTTLATLVTADFDNNGLTDIFLSGHSGTHLFGRVYQALGNGPFAPMFSPFPTNVAPFAAWGDYNRDGTLDLALSAGTEVSLYRNYIAKTNQPPLPPQGLTANGGVNRIRFAWSAATDAETPAATLTYNLRVGRSPGAGDVVPVDAAPNGVRRLAAAGNAGLGLNKTVRDLTFGRYYWAVQSVDSSFAGSTFTPENIFIYVVGTAPATSVSSTVATLNGVLDTNQLPVTAWFEWGADTNLSSRTIASSIGTNGAFSAALGNLLSGTTYYFRATLSNETGIFYGSVLEFKTVGVPSFSTLSFANVTSSSARFIAGVNPNRGMTLAWFEYGLTDSYGFRTITTNIGVADHVLTFGQNSGPLLGGTLYFVRVGASNEAGVAYGNPQTFRTTYAPEALTLLATVGVTNATLNGQVRANGLSTLACFEWGPTPNYGQRTVATNVGTQSVAVAVNTTLIGLLRDTTYYYRVVAENSYATNYGIGRSFSTTNDVVTHPATAVNFTSATLHGLVHPNGLETSVFFQLGSTSTPAMTLPAGTQQVAVSQLASNLLRDTLYSFRVVASNAAGMRSGKLLSFRTPWTFNATTSSVPGIIDGVIVPGDFNNDGSMDLVVAGSSSTRAYRNAGAGTFTPVGSLLPPLRPGSLDVGDFDNDGWVDILLAGQSGSTPISKLYRNNRNDTFTEVAAPFAPIQFGSIKFGDFDSDGKADILIAGVNGETPVTRLYRNTGNGQFTEQNLTLPQYLDPTATWCDYNKDGRPDITLLGRVGIWYSNVFTRLLRNDGNGTFTELDAGLPGIRLGSAEWADYNSDGWPDLLVAGRGTGLNDVVRLLRNNGNGTFSDATGSFPQFACDAALWGDYDNDGRFDVLARGQKYISSSLPPRSYSAVSRNSDDGNFGYSQFPLPEIWSSAGGWADTDGDHRLDVVMSGNSRTGPQSIIYRNNELVSNVRPNPPGALSSAVSNSTVRLFWQLGSDSQTPAAGLSYNLRVGTTSALGNIVSPLADTNGFRRVVTHGNMGQNLQFELTGLAPGRYFWSVQSIDSAFEGSSFAPEATVFVGPPAIAYLRPEPDRLLIGVSAVPNTSNILEASTNLLQWIDVMPFSVPQNGTSEIVQPRTFNSRFFRLRSP